MWGKGSGAKGCDRYTESAKTFKVYIPERKNVYFSRAVKFVPPILEGAIQQILPQTSIPQPHGTQITQISVPIMERHVYWTEHPPSTLQPPTTPKPTYPPGKYPPLPEQIAYRPRLLETLLAMGIHKGRVDGVESAGRGRRRRE